MKSPKSSRNKVRELPPLPLVVRKLVKILNNEMSSAEDVMKVLTTDQALASKVLKLVNSSFYGMPRSPFPHAELGTGRQFCYK